MVVVVVEVEVLVLLLVDVVVAMVVVVVAGGHVPGSHVPAPTSTPPCPAQSSGDTTTHWSKAPIGDDCTQHCVSGHSQHEVRELTVPPFTSHFAADGETLQLEPTIQVLVLAAARRAVVLAGAGLLVALAELRPVADDRRVVPAAGRARGGSGPRHRGIRRARACGPHPRRTRTYSPCFVAAAHGHCASMAACAAQLSALQSTWAVGVRGTKQRQGEERGPGHDPHSIEQSTVRHLIRPSLAATRRGTNDGNPEIVPILAVHDFVHGDGWQPDALVHLSRSDDRPLRVARKSCVRLRSARRGGDWRAGD